MQALGSLITVPRARLGEGLRGEQDRAQVLRERQKGSGSGPPRKERTTGRREGRELSRGAESVWLELGRLGGEPGLGRMGLRMGSGSSGSGLGSK